MTRFFVFLLCSAFAGCSCQAQVYRQAAPVHPGAVFPADYQSTLGDSLVILSWNLENFVDGHDDPYVANGRENRGEVDAAKVEAIKEVLLFADVDVLAFQETESADWVEQLCEEHWPELGYLYFGGARTLYCVLKCNGCQPGAPGGNLKLWQRAYAGRFYLGMIIKIIKPED
jgi:hypothetical protein